jgi:hypothetical protein
MPQLFHDDFSGLPVGPLPTDFLAAGEYHFAPPERWRLSTGVGPGPTGPWYEPMRGDWRPHAPWVVLEDDGRHRLLQAIAAGKRFPRILVAGDPRDELVVWDMERLWIYTQDRPFEGDRVYRPIRYPHYNASNYRAEISLLRWAGGPGGD